MVIMLPDLFCIISIILFLPSQRAAEGTNGILHREINSCTLCPSHIFHTRTHTYTLLYINVFSQVFIPVLLIVAKTNFIH